MLELAWMPFWGLIAALAVLAAVIVAAGTKLAALADKIADATGWGEATVGAVLLGGSTSLAGIVASVSAAATGHPTMAISNAIGGIAVQTAFLAIADMFYPRTNLEHAAASTTNLFQASLLIALLTLPLLGAALPDTMVVGWVSPVSVVLVLGYALGVRAAGEVRLSPMWRPRSTDDMQSDEEKVEKPTTPTSRLLLLFSGLAATTAVVGYLLTATALEVGARTGMAETVIGGLITAVITSLPELVTSIAAVRRGALNLAVGGIIGGNAFDTLFLAFSDFAYSGERNFYAFFAQTHQLMTIITILMTAVLLMGLVARPRSGGKIGWESTIVLVLYAVLTVLMTTTDNGPGPSG